MSPQVQDFCQKLWDARAAGKLPAAPAISRGLAVAVARDVLAGESYDPYEDRRVEWAQEVVKARTWLRPQFRPEASPELEYVAAMLLERSEPARLTGRDLAAGEKPEDRSQKSDASENFQLSTAHP